MRILITGAGAMGSVFGCFLRKMGLDVTLLGRAWHIDAMERDGLRIEGIWGEHWASGFGLASSTDQLEGMFDTVIVSVKSYDTEGVVKSILPFLKDDSIVVSFQNGIGNMDRIAGLAGSSRCGGARIIFGAEMVAPGRVRVTVYADPVMIGAFEPGRYPALDERLKRLAGLIDSSGIPCRFTEDIHPYLWAKLLYNCALNPLGAILKVEYGKLMERCETREIMDRLIDEVFEVARAKGIKLQWDSPDEYRDIFYSRLVPDTYRHRSSMLQDMERGKETEIEAMNGIVCRYGRELGLDTRTNMVLYNLIRYLSTRL